MDIKIAQQETITELVLENQKLKQERDEWRKAAFEITAQSTKSRKQLEREFIKAMEDASQLSDRLSGLELRTTEELAKLERERNEWAAMCGRYKQERDEAIEQNAKLRDISERAIWRAVNGVCLPDASAVRAIKEEGLRLRAELDQLK